MGSLLLPTFLPVVTCRARTNQRQTCGEGESCWCRVESHGHTNSALVEVKVEVGTETGSSCMLLISEIVPVRTGRQRRTMITANNRLGRRHRRQDTIFISSKINHCIGNGGSGKGRGKGREKERKPSIGRLVTERDTFSGAHALTEVIGFA